MGENKELVVREQGIVSDVAPEKWALILSQSDAVVKSGICPKGYTKETVAVIALTGREYGLGIMQSLRSLYVVNNKAAMMADMMAGLVFAKLPGAKIDVVESTDKVATFEASRPGGKPARLSFTMADAKVAGLTGKDTWNKYPAQMLRARAQAAIARLVFPDVVAGLYTPEELNAPVTESGAVIVEATVVSGARAPISEPQAKPVDTELPPVRDLSQGGAGVATDKPAVTKQSTDAEKQACISDWALELTGGDSGKCEALFTEWGSFTPTKTKDGKLIPEDKQKVHAGKSNVFDYSGKWLSKVFETAEKAYYFEKT